VSYTKAQARTEWLAPDEVAVGMTSADLLRQGARLLPLLYNGLA
jgi:hypothetical protein